MIPLALFLGFGILAMGSEVLAIHAGFAEQLDLPGAWIIPWMPVIATVLFGLAVFGIRRMKRFRWMALFIAYFLGHAVTVWTLSLYQHATMAIHLPARPNKDSLAQFDTAYPVKRAFDPSSGRGVVMRVRPEDYSEAMAQFAKELVEHQKGEYP